MGTHDSRAEDGRSVLDVDRFGEMSAIWLVDQSVFGKEPISRESEQELLASLAVTVQSASTRAKVSRALTCCGPYIPHTCTYNIRRGASAKSLCAASNVLKAASIDVQKPNLVTNSISLLSHRGVHFVNVTGPLMAQSYCEIGLAEQFLLAFPSRLFDFLSRVCCTSTAMISEWHNEAEAILTRN